MPPPRPLIFAAALLAVCLLLLAPAHLGRSALFSFPNVRATERRASVAARAAAATTYLLGTGIGDVTGPVVQIGFMGYADLAQTGTGLHMRQRARAFFIADKAAPSDRVGVYTEKNFALAGTHSHAGVGGYVENLLPQLTSLGFVKQAYDAIFAGVVVSVQRAHERLAEGTLHIGNSTLLNSNLNRSPTAYLANPVSERAQYQYDVDKDFTLLRFDDAGGSPRGFLSFFAVHGTSLYQNNTLVSGDNKGMAAYLSKAHFNPSALPGNSSFVAGFAQSNVGDTTPNTGGAYCESPGESYDGQPCDADHSTCGGTVQDCHGRGPAFQVSDFASNEIIGRNQHEAARALVESTLVPISGSVRSAHQYINMSNYTFALPNGTRARTCPAALGYGFAGGTTDGPGAADFIQGSNTSTSQNPFWEIVKGAVSPYPNAEQRACHAPKPILLNTGYSHAPHDWSPAIISIQVFRVGSLVILLSPSELTTMAGRRLRNTVRAKLIADGVLDDSAYVVIGSIANGAYSHYTTTREEYGVQRYEGGSTIYSPATLEGYQNIFSNLVPFLASNTTTSPSPGTPPPNLLGSALSLQTGVIYDGPPLFKKFGNVLTDVKATPYVAGSTVSAVFVGANPRNHLRLEDTSNISWKIESGTPAGSYRIQYFGNSKAIGGKITAFTGTSSTFTVV